jgi:putative transposase
MSKHRFQKGMHIELRGRDCVIEERLPGGDLRLRDAALNESSSVSEATLVNALFDGELIIRGDFRAVGTSLKDAVSSVDLDMLSDDDPRKCETKRRWAYVNAIASAKLEAMNADTLIPIIKRVHQEIQDPNDVPYWKTVYYRWFKSFVESGEDPRVLAPQFKKRGNKQRRFAKGSKAKGQKFSEKELKLALEVADVVEDVINEEYLNPQRLSVSEVYDKLEIRIADINKLRDAGDQLPTPHKDTIYDIVSRLDEYEKDRARFGKRYADNKHRCNKQALQPTRPLERTEIDHTKLDLFVVDEETRLPLGRPTLTMLLDKFSREVLGICNGFDPPSYLSVMNCLLHAIKPKSYVKKEFPAVQNDWEAYGLPELIVVDNGKEFHSKAFEDACLQLGIVVMYSPPYQPRYKGAIERFFSTLNKRLLHQQRGTTFSNIFERRDYDPRKNAVISFSAFMELLHVWIADVYHQSYHRGLRDIPAHVWREGIKQHPPALPGRAEELRVLLGHVEHRVIGPSGVELHTLFYNCEELSTLRGQPGVKGTKFAVKYDPEDISAVYVYDRLKDKYLAVPALDQNYARGLSLWQHQVIQANAKRDAMGRVNMDALRVAKKMIQGIVDAEMARGGKSGARARGARWNGVRQPDYHAAHLDVQDGQDAMDVNQGDRSSDTPLIVPDVHPLEGMSDVESAPLNMAQEDAGTQPPAAVIDLASEVEKRAGKKARANRSKRVGNTASQHARYPDAADTTKSLAAGEDDLDVTGFNASYSLPK